MFRVRCVTDSSVTLFFAALLLLVLGAGACASPPEQDFHLYILAGQSNMAGRGTVEAEDREIHPRVFVLNKDDEWAPAADPLHFDKPVAGVGPGFSFGKTLARMNPDVRIGLIPCAAGGSPIDSWKPGGYWEQTKSHPYDDAVNRARIAMKKGVLKGIIWHQGESDSSPEKAPLYGEKLAGLGSRLRADLGIPDLAFVAGTLADFYVKRSSDAETVNRAIRSLPEKLDRVSYIESSGLSAMEDGVHFDAASEREMGRRFARAMMTLIPGIVHRDIKIGQMLMVGFRGLEVDEGHVVVRDIKDRCIGGVVLFDYDVPAKSPVRNVQSPGQVKRLIHSLREAADIPLLVAVDQEGGRIQRLKEKFGFPKTMSHQETGRRSDASLTAKNAAVIASALHEAGFNMNFAPVVDLNVNPANPIIGKLGRSFSADPATVSAHARAYIQAHHMRGVLCCLKHFPGHGSSREDSHLGLVDVTATWSDAELEPYRSLIAAGEVDAVMTAHVFHEKLDPEYPATLSKKIITGILRERLGFDGVVVTDDMQMGAIANHYGFEKAIEKSIDAGVDIITLANNTLYEENIAERAAGVIKDLLDSGVLNEERLDQSFMRIMKLKSGIQ